MSSSLKSQTTRATMPIWRPTKLFRKCSTSWGAYQYLRDRVHDSWLPNDARQQLRRIISRLANGSHVNDLSLPSNKDRCAKSSSAAVPLLEKMSAPHLPTLICDSLCAQRLGHHAVAASDITSSLYMFGADGLDDRLAWGKEA
jgi:hypothetical protein